jgi:hypothetical protein
MQLIVHCPARFVAAIPHRIRVPVFPQPMHIITIIDEAMASNTTNHVSVSVFLYQDHTPTVQTADRRARGGSRGGWNRGNGLKILNVINNLLTRPGSLSPLFWSLGLIHHNTELPVTD